MIAIEEICFPLGAPPELTRAAEEITQALAASSEVCADVVAEIQRSMAQLAITWEAMGAAQELQRQELQKSVAQITQAWEGIDLTAVFTEQAKVAEQALAEQASVMASLPAGRDLVFDPEQLAVLRPKPLVFDPPWLRDDSPVRVSRPIPGFQRR